ncbi:hypothetical protein, partial [Escherichia coli]
MISRICVLATASVLLALTACGTGEPEREIPEGIPPGPGTEVPAIDFNAPGRTADLLLAWAEPQTEALGISVTALASYGHAAAIMTET